MARGKKNCPSCNTELGARTQLCSSCGYHYLSQKVRKDLLQERTEKPKTKKKHGPIKHTKECTNCGKEIGFRTHLCTCGWYYPENKLRTDLLEAKNKRKVKYYETEGQGRKRCPSCDKVVGGILKTCYCGFDFAAAKAKKDQEIEEQKSLKKKAREDKRGKKQSTSPVSERLIREIGPFVYKAPYFPSKREHAEEILSRGEERAKFLYDYAKRQKIWKHVDWGYIGRALGLEGEEVLEEELEEGEEQEELEVV